MIASVERRLQVQDDGAPLRGALLQLRRLQTGSQPIKAKIRTARLQLPDGRVTTLLTLLAGRINRQPAKIIALPSADRSYATTAYGERLPFDPAWFDGATVDHEGNIQLKDRSYLHDFELRPTVMPELTPRQERIVHLTIFYLQQGDECFREVHPSLPGMRRLDYSKLPGLKLPRAKILEAAIAKAMPDVTRQEIPVALQRAGFRRPGHNRKRRN